MPQQFPQPQGKIPPNGGIFLIPFAVRQLNKYACGAMDPRLRGDDNWIALQARNDKRNGLPRCARNDKFLNSVL